MSELATMIGQLFVPLLTKVLPVINGITVALKRLVSVIASLFGIEIDMSQFGNGFDEGAEGAEDIEDSMEGASKASKKLKQNLLGMDELNVINSDQNTGGTGGGGGSSIDLSEQIEKATEEYEKAWEEAYKRMEDKIKEIADKIDKILEPIKGILANLFSDNFFAAGYGIGELSKKFFDWFSEIIRGVDWGEVGGNIVEFIAGIDWLGLVRSVGNFFESIIDSAVELWKGAFDAQPIATSIITALSVAKFTGLGKALATALTSALTAQGCTITTTAIVAAVTWVIGFNVGKSLGKALFPDDAQYYEDFTFFGNDGFFNRISEDWGVTLKAISSMWNDFVNSDFQTWLFDKVTEPSSKGLMFAWVEDMPTAIGKAWYEITDIWDKSQDWLFKNVTEPFLDNVIKGWEKMGGSIGRIWDGIKAVARASMNYILIVVESMINGIIDGINAFFFPLNGFIELASSMFGIEGLKPISLFDNVSLPRISGYYNGGYPKSYSMFMAGENGVPELLGTVGGKTAVASGAEITGIREEIRNTANEEMILLRQQNQLLQGILEKEFGITKKAVYKAVVEENSKNKNTFKPYFATN